MEREERKKPGKPDKPSDLIEYLIQKNLKLLKELSKY